jgi:erythromycin esterase
MTLFRVEIVPFTIPVLIHYEQRPPASGKDPDVTASRLRCLCFAILLSLPALTYAQTPPSGDLNQDSVIDLQDAQIALRIAVGLQTATAQEVETGDVVGTGPSAGRIDLADTLRILRHAVGLEPLGEVTLADQIRARSTPLETSQDLDPLIARVGNARYVLLGEASHGTHEFYTWRSAISQRLIQERGFTFIAVEGDWPDVYQLNRYVRGDPSAGATAREAMRGFERWPTWMWANEEIVDLAEWIRTYNQTQPEERKVGIYGLDVYSPQESLRLAAAYLSGFGEAAATAARTAQTCLEPFGEEMTGYIWAALGGQNTCEDEIAAMRAALQQVAPQARAADPEAFFNAEQNALVAANGERYYRTLNSVESWNLRDTHMVETLDRLIAHLGPTSKALVWEHNTHIGDARATNMDDIGMFNVGQLVRERHAAEGVVAVGFGTYAGTVVAGRQWGATLERMTVPPGREGSWEDAFHDAGGVNRLLILTDEDGQPRVGSAFMAERGHRAIGVVYNPNSEAGNYVPTILPRRYDAFLFFERTEALRPVETMTSGRT